MKTYRQTTSGEDRVSALVLLNIEREFETDYDENART
ncbi:unnamed protein product, partial [Rotaria magnacalcarata]